MLPKKTIFLASRLRRRIIDEEIFDRTSARSVASSSNFVNKISTVHRVVVGGRSFVNEKRTLYELRGICSA